MCLLASGKAYQLQVTFLRLFMELGTRSRQNKQNDLCAQRRLRSAWAATQSDQT